MSLGVPSSRHALEEAANTQKMRWSTFQGPSSPLRRCPAHGPPALSAGSSSGPSWVDLQPVLRGDSASPGSPRLGVHMCARRMDKPQVLFR